MEKIRGGLFHTDGGVGSYLVGGDSSKGPTLEQEGRLALLAFGMVKRMLAPTRLTLPCSHRLALPHSVLTAVPYQGRKR